MKKLKIFKSFEFYSVLFSLFLVNVTLATPSPNWYQESGNYKLKDSAGNYITSAWVCDDVDDGKPWYLLDTKGNIVTGLACDSGKWYFLESNGKLKFDSYYYYGIYLDKIIQLEQ